ncbi:MAG TPA: DEAD/DEAH box helicase [Rhodopila sp.]|nr:DEAD/DEAH box helicase [Rhodopila sp.]
MHIVPLSADIDPTLAIREADIKRCFTASTLSAGRSYEQRGRVQELQISSAGAVISALTQGTQPDPYVQNLRVARMPSGGVKIVGACSCPMRAQCKHVAAVAIAAQRRENILAKSAAALSSPRRLPRATEAEASKLAAKSPLPVQIRDWLSGFDGEDDELTEEYPASVRTRVYYVLGPEAAHMNGSGVPRLVIDPMTVTLRKDGSAGSIRRYAPHQVQTPAKYLRPSDLVVLSRLARRASGLLMRADDDPVDTLRRILATGRARWGNAEGPGVTEGTERPGQITWITRPDASQQASLSVDEGLTAVRLPQPWYVDTATGTIGPIGFDLPAKVVGRLLDAPPIPPEAASEVRSQLASRMPAAKLPVPNELQPAETVQEIMRPHLRLISGALPMDPNYGRGSARPLRAGLYAVPLARLSYGYGDITLPRSARPLPRLTMRDGRIYDIVRDLQAESDALDQLRQLGFLPVSDLVHVYYQHAHSDDFALREGGGASYSWLDFVTQEVPRLREAGWIVEIDTDFPLQVITADAEIDAELVEGSGIDWLELNLGVQIDGQRVDLIPPLLKLIARPEAALTADAPDDKPFILPLPDGRMLSLPLARIRPTLLALLELWSGGGLDAENGKIGFSRLQAAELAELEVRTGLTWRGGEALRDLGRVLREEGGIPVATLPETFNATLRPYQAQGVSWLQFLAMAGLGGVLADDMGLGKTVQTLAHLAIEKAAGRLDRPCLIVCPTSVIPNWTSEARRFAPTLSVLPLHGPKRKAAVPLIPSHDIVLSTYPLLTRDHDVLVAQEWHIVILDEAQSIKNPQAEATRQVLRLKAKQRLCLSGTPLQNHLGELWSLFDFLAPGFLGSARAFKTRFRTPIEKHGDAERQGMLSRRIRPFMLRRTKEEVVTELPPKVEIVEQVEMETNQHAIYEAIRLSMHAKVQAAITQKGLARSGIIILDALLKMRQACCDPRLLKLKTVAKTKAGSAKLDRLMEMLEVMFSEGRRVLLFSQFTEMLGLIEERLQEDGVRYVTLTGDTRDRAAPVRKFQGGDVPLFLISLKAGGVGLNLTAADTVIHYDPWWNPAVEDQATDRAYRIGQTKKVFVHRMVTLGSIEEKMEILKEKKRAIVASVMNAEHGGALSLTEADVEDLFSPSQ